MWLPGEGVGAVGNVARGEVVLVLPSRGSQEMSPQPSQGMQHLVRQAGKAATHVSSLKEQESPGSARDLVSSLENNLSSR